MSERCPLRLGLYWEMSDEQPIPEFCREHCGSTWESAMSSAGEVDEMGSHKEQCESEPEYAGMFLRRAARHRFGSERFVTILHECFEHVVITDSESWTFQCPHN